MPKPTTFSYTVEDENGETGTMLLYVSYNATTETVSALLGAAAAYGGVLDAITGGVITEFNVTINALADPAWKDTPVADTDIQKGFLFNFDVTDTVYPQEVWVPGALGSLIDSNGRPTYTGTALEDFADVIVAPTGGVSAQNKYLLDLTGFRSVGVSFRKRKGSLKASKVSA